MSTGLSDGSGDDADTWRCQLPQTIIYLTVVWIHGPCSAHSARIKARFRFNPRVFNKYTATSSHKCFRTFMDAIRGVSRRRAREYYITTERGLRSTQTSSARASASQRIRGRRSAQSAGLPMLVLVSMPIKYCSLSDVHLPRKRRQLPLFCSSASRMGHSGEEQERRGRRGRANCIGLIRTNTSYNRGTATCLGTA